MASAQSLKSNATSLSFKLPMKNDFGFTSYSRKITTNLFLLTGSEAKEALDKNARNEEKKSQLANEFLGFFGKAMKLDKVNGELLIEFVTSDFVLREVVEDIAAAKEDDVVAKIEGKLFYAIPTQRPEQKYSVKSLLFQQKMPPSQNQKSQSLIRAYPSR